MSKSERPHALINAACMKECLQHAWKDRTNVWKVPHGRQKFKEKTGTLKKVGDAYGSSDWLSNPGQSLSQTFL